jgi:hypothetical protein
MVICSLGSSATSTRLFGCFFLSILVSLLLSMMIDCFNDYVHACSLGIAVQIRTIGEPSLVFIALWFDFLWLLLKNYKIMLWKKKEFEDLKYLLVSFRLYFIIARNSLYICLYKLYVFFKILYKLCGIDCKKRELSLWVKRGRDRPNGHYE